MNYKTVKDYAAACGVVEGTIYLRLTKGEIQKDEAMSLKCKGVVIDCDKYPPEKKKKAGRGKIVI